MSNETISTTTEQTDIPAPEVATAIEVNKVYVSMAVVISTLRKNWKVITGVLAALTALAGFGSHN